MAAGEETLRDIEKKAAGEVASLFGGKSRKIAVLAESPTWNRIPTEALQNKFLPAVEQILLKLGFTQTETMWNLNSGQVEPLWTNPLTGETTFSQELFSRIVPSMEGNKTVEQYAKESTYSLPVRLSGEAGLKRKLNPDVKKELQQFYRLVGTDLKKQPEERDPTFVDEAEWLKRYLGGEKVLAKHPRTGKVTEGQLPRPPWAEVEVYPFYGEEELRQRGQEIAEEYEGETVSLGIFGHAGRRFGGVGVGQKPWREAFQDVDIDTAFIGACSMTNKPEVCEVMSGSLSQEDKEAVVVLAQNMPWGTSPGQAPEEPSVKVAFQKEADIGVFKASPELREKVQTGEWERERFPSLESATSPCAGLTGNELSDCEAGHMLYNLFQGVAGIFRQRQAPTAPTFRGGTPAHLLRQ
jgi:hypothetical protein